MKRSHWHDSDEANEIAVCVAAAAPATSPQVRVFAINLQRSAERWALLEPQLQALGLPWERFDAVDGRTVQSLESFGGYSAVLNRRGFHRPLSRGEAACYESHLGVLRRFLDTGAGYALVLEDDVALSPDLGDAIAAALQAAEPWDLVKLGSISRKPVRRERRVGRFFWRSYWKIPISGFAHLVSRPGAERLLAARRCYGRPFDVDLQFWWETGLRIRGLEPYPVRIRSALDSDIGQSGGRPSPYAWHSSLRARLRLQFGSFWHAYRAHGGC